MSKNIQVAFSLLRPHMKKSIQTIWWWLYENDLGIGKPIQSSIETGYTTILARRNVDFAPAQRMRATVNNDLTPTLKRHKEDTATAPFGREQQMEYYHNCIGIEYWMFKCAVVKDTEVRQNVAITTNPSMLCQIRSQKFHSQSISTAISFWWHPPETQPLPVNVLPRLNHVSVIFCEIR